MSRKDCMGYRIFLGIVLVIVVGIAVWYGILTFVQTRDFEDATLVRMLQEEREQV